LLKKREHSDRIILQWEIKSKKDVERVLIYKATGDAALQLYNNSTENSYTDEEILPDKTYRYRIKAIYVDGTSSALSNEVTVKL
jgi:fibronectin type 3 domain-containing protein